MSFLPSILACAVCMPDPDSSVSRAAGFAIFFMITMVAIVLSVFLKVIFNFARKQRDCSETSH